MGTLIYAHPCCKEILDRLKEPDGQLIDADCDLTQELGLLADDGAEVSRLTSMGKEI